MREKLARLIAILTGLMVLLLAIAFAAIQNPELTQAPVVSAEKVLPPVYTESIVLNPEHIKAGHLVYQQQACALCHSIAGEGNIRNPLDGVGTRRTPEELRNWIVGADVLEGTIPQRAFKMKQDFKELPDHELDMLVTYMQSLRY